MNNISNFIINFNIRTDIAHGAEHFVVPIVALVEGVHVGSGGAGFYPAAELDRTAQNWNGVPLTIDHPKDIKGTPITANNPDTLKQYKVGTFENVHYEGGKLKGEGWIDKNLITQISPKTLGLIMSGSKLEVSTGLFTKSDGVAGEWRGERFQETLSDFIPDHLALLPEAEGACNFDAGCGVRMNKKKGCGKCLKTNASIGLKTADVDLMKLSLKKNGYWVNELSHSKLREQLFGLVSGMDKEGTIHFLRDVFDKSFVFEEVKENKSRLLRQGFKTDNEDQVSTKGNATEVREDVKFIPINNNLLEGDLLMERKDQVDALIANEKLPYVEADREMLTNQEQESFDRTFSLNECGCGDAEGKSEELLKANEALTTTNKDLLKEVAELKVNTEGKKDLIEKPSFDDLLNASDAETKEAWGEMKANQKAKKDRAVEAILAIKTNVFEKEVLDAMTISALENIIALTPVVNDYSGNGGPAPKPKALNLNERQADGSGVPLMPTEKWNADGTPDFSHLS